MLLSNPIINGTIILTFAGGASRFIGFFYRIFLTRTIGAEGLGIYQLICPAMALGYALCCAGFQTAISKLIAEARNSRKKYLVTGIILSIAVSVLLSAIIYLYADFIAQRIICEPRCSRLLQIMSFSLVPSAIHACINGYYYGLKKTAIPAFSQLVEQFVRVGSVYLIYIIKESQGLPIQPSDVVWGITICEVAGLLFSVTSLYFTKSSSNDYAVSKQNIKKLPNYAYEICNLAVPMSLNHFLLTLCTGLENILLPIQLQKYGFTATDSLSIFGILSGVALPVLLFPSVLTNSLCVLLLPDISEAQAKEDTAHIKNITKKALLYGALFGLGFTLLFRFSGGFIGNKIFDSALASHYILRLCWLCPFIYISSLLSSILNGLGKPKSVLFTNILSGGIRISMILIAVPVYGIDAYLWSILVAQIFSTMACTYLVKHSN